MPKKKIRTIKVFIASPGDLAVERAAFKAVVDELNSGFADGANVCFEAIGWEDTLAMTGRRSQGVINLEIDNCDVFVLALYARWGQEAPDAAPYSSYTEEEFHRALARWKKVGSPEIFVFFKDVSPREMADPGVQLQRVLEFRKELERTRQVIYRPFTDEASFKSEINTHLRAFAKDALPKIDPLRDMVLFPLGALEEIEKERAEKQRALLRAEEEHQAAEAAIARAEELTLDFAERAAKAALEGRVEEARQDFAKATNGTTNLRVLYLAYEFYYRTGNLTAAEEMLERLLAISGRNSECAETASAICHLGNVWLMRGNLDEAEKMYCRSLEIEEKLGRREGMASNFGNLGIIFETRGDLDGAKKMYGEALEINIQLGREEGVARQYGNLGSIYRSFGNLDEAEKMYRMALEINKKLGLQQGMAADYGDLGVIFDTRGDLDEAEKMHCKSLELSEKLGLQEGMAIHYANLGGIYEQRGVVKTAREYWTKSRDLYQSIGMPHMSDMVQGWLDGLPTGES